MLVSDCCSSLKTGIVADVGIFCRKHSKTQRTWHTVQ